MMEDGITDDDIIDELELYLPINVFSFWKKQFLFYLNIIFGHMAFLEIQRQQQCGKQQMTSVTKQFESQNLISYWLF